MKSVARLLAGLILWSLTGVAADKPNVLWILSEDNSKHYLRLYGNPLGVTPRIEALAEQGVVFDNAFSCGPVCSVARTTLMTGIYAPRAGFQYHRKMKPAQLSPGLLMWPAYLRKAGYYTSNNAKKDYNVVEAKGAVWDESSNKASWRKRPTPDTPFFHMQTIGQSHESSLHFKAETIDPGALKTPVDEVKLAPYHPDTPTFRYTYARYHDRMREIDTRLGRIIDQLTEDGLLEDTFIFYFGDHGGVLPRSKGYVYESGLNVPLVVRIPEKWRHLTGLKSGTRSPAFVEFIDFGPTVMQLAGVTYPSGLDGKPFLGADLTPARLVHRDEAFGYADRFDEKYDLVRSLRKGRYKYIRNYHPFYPDGLQNNYRYIMLAYSEWRTLYREGKLNAAQRQFFEPRAPEQLFDIRTDPHEVNNLAGDPRYAPVLEDLRSRLQKRLKGLNDLSFFPESYMIEHALGDGMAFGREHSKEIAHLIDIADLSLQPYNRVEKKLKRALHSRNPWERYWALINCSVFGTKALPLLNAVQEQLTHEEWLVRLRAIEFLGIIGAEDPRPALYEIVSANPSPAETLITLNTAVFFTDHRPDYPFDVKRVGVRNRANEVQRRLDYLGGTLKK